MSAERFYVYRLFDKFETLYIGKGSGRRIDVQKCRHRCDGEILERHATEKAAYKAERRIIAKWAPSLNRHPGGNGSRACRQRRPAWEMEIERVGSRVYAAKFLLSVVYPFDQNMRAALVKVVEAGGG